MTDTTLHLALFGDVMLGRGVDQVRLRSCDPRLYEPYVRDARDYVTLAERANGPIPAPVTPDYVWGDVPDELARLAPDLRLINLETAVTAGGEPRPGKGIHYRMHPANVDSLRALDVDACVLANNHVLDWSEAGLRDTMDALREAGIAHAGAGENADAARAPVRLDAGGHGRVHLFAACLGDSGVPPEWAAGDGRPGVYRLDDDADARVLAEAVAGAERGGGAVVVSLHWGGNWGYDVAPEHRRLAHELIEAGANLIHGHSCHHPKGVELYRDRPILYGCGDFLNDYEGIAGHEHLRSDLVVAWLARLNPDGALVDLTLLPFRIRRFSLHRAAVDDARWLAERLSEENPDPGLRFAATEEAALKLVNTTAA